MDMSWEDIRLFLAVAERGSLSAAARALRLGQPTMSRRIAELEEAVGQPLFRRGVRGVELTAHGLSLLQPAQRMAEWAVELERAASRDTSSPDGVVRITAPPGIAVSFLAPFAAWLRTQLPRVRLEVVSSVQYLDLSRREADLALRMRSPTQRDLVTVASLTHDNAVFVAQSYADRLPKKLGFADLDWIGWAPPLDRLSPNPELEAMIPGFAPVFASDDFLVQLAAAEAGLGAVVLGKWRHRFSGASRLVPLALDLGPHARSSLYLVSTKSALLVPRVREVADRLAAELRSKPTPAPSRPPRTRAASRVRGLTR